MAEIVACPNCQRKLQVPEQYLGMQVQCPECRHMFTATTKTASAPAPPPPPPTPRSDDRRRDDYDRPSRRGRYDDEEDDRDYDDVRQRGQHRYRAPHRGTLILVLGLLSLFACGLLGPIAWIMGNTDLSEIRAGRMDPAGEGQTRVGQVCGIIATIVLILAGIVMCLGRH